MKHHFQIDVIIDTPGPIDTDAVEMELNVRNSAHKFVKGAHTMSVSAYALETPDRSDGTPEVHRAAQSIASALAFLDDGERLSVLEWALSRCASIRDEKTGLVYEPHDFAGPTQACAQCGRGKRDRLHSGG